MAAGRPTEGDLTMLAECQKKFSSSTTCVLDRPTGENRSCLDWLFGEEAQNDFGHFTSGGNYAQEAKELAAALDQYKMIHRRRYLSFEEMMAILHSMGYRRN